MRTDYIVTVVAGSHPDTKTTKGHHEVFKDAIEEARTFALHPHAPPSVVIVWARQGRNMWPVRIYYPGTDHSLDGPPVCLPFPSPAPIYTLSTFQPSGFPLANPPLSDFPT